MMKFAIVKNPNYFPNQTSKDYYVGGNGEPPGFWAGSGCDSLGLKGEVDNHEFLKLMGGYSPTGTKLVQNAGDENRLKAYDLCVNVPKSTSVQWALARDGTSRQIDLIARSVVNGPLMDYIEKNCLFTRRGKSGIDAEHAKPVVAVFPHCTSRSSEPHLHYHLVLANCCVREDGTTGTLYGRVIKDEDGNVIETKNPITDHLKTMGAIFQAELARGLLEELGIRCQPSQNGFSFEIEGIPQQACDMYSTRKKQIDEASLRAGFESAEARQIACLATRESKVDVCRPKLREKWKSELSQFGLTSEFAESLCNQSVERRLNPSREIKNAINESQVELTTNRGSFEYSKLVQRTTNRLVATGIPFSRIEAEIDDEITQGDLVSLGEDNFQRVLSTKASLQMEYACCLQLEKAQFNHLFKVAPDDIQNAIKKSERENRFEFDQDYRDAITYLTTGITKDGHESGANRVLVGNAGAGKTTLLKTVKTAFESQGFRVVGAALSGRAADQLQTKAEIPSATIEKWNHELGKSFAQKARFQQEMYGRAAMGKHTWQPDRTCELDDRTVLIIDEAAMCDTPKLYELYSQAREAGSLVIWSGDDKQVQAIGHGGAFGMAQRISGAARLTRNFRQQNDADKELVEKLAQGKTVDALKHLASHGNLHVQPSESEGRDKLVADWKNSATGELKKHQIFVAKNKDRMDINSMCQAAVRSRVGRLLGIGLTNHEGNQLYRGDRVVFRENMILTNQYDCFANFLRGHSCMAITGNRKGTERIRNGQLGTVLFVNPIDKSLRVRMDDGRSLNVPTNVLDEEKKNIFGSYHTNVLGKKATRKLQISLGYATTTHAGQGSDFDHVHVLAGGKMQNKEISYTQLTRHKHSLNVYTSELEAGKELTLTSMIAQAKEIGTDKLNALKSKLEVAENNPGDRAKDSLLAKRMRTSNRKKFGLETSKQLETLRAELERNRFDMMERHLRDL